MKMNLKEKNPRFFTSLIHSLNNVKIETMDFNI